MERGPIVMRFGSTASTAGCSQPASLLALPHVDGLFRQAATCPFRAERLAMPQPLRPRGSALALEP